MEKKIGKIILNYVEKEPFQGWYYNSIERSVCLCECHDTDSSKSMMHFTPCCNDGYIEKVKFEETKQEELKAKYENQTK